MQTPPRYLFSVLLLCGCCLLLSFRDEPECNGVYRWDNKLLIDAVGLQVYKKKAVASSLRSVTHIARPAASALGSNRGSTEQRKVYFTAWLVGRGTEDDGDYHLILASPNFKDSMIAEIPSPNCAKLQHFPGLRDAFTNARRFVDDNTETRPQSVHFLTAPVKIKITGVLFFDKMAHGMGHARNGIELHPVLSIKKA